MLNKNLIKQGNKNILSLYNKSLTSRHKKEIKNFGNKTFISKDRKSKNDLWTESNNNKENENIEINNYKSINGDDYKKKLIENFKLEMEAQRVARKKMAKKIFLPPLTYFSPGKTNFPIIPYFNICSSYKK
jgi:hypothetical protein